MIARAYYNEIDPVAAQHLRNLIDAGHIAPGDVDERSIEDVQPADLDGYAQCHFFAGIGVWSYALRSAGWADDRPVWTGSCPCQPFSAAGKGAAFNDERHLWPAWFHLIKERRPATIFGEQVASKDADPWIDLVQDDLEGLAYAVGAVAFPSAGVGAPHIRDRCYWAADSSDQRQNGRRTSQAGDRRDSARVELERLCDTGELADADRNGRTPAPGAKLYNAQPDAEPRGPVNGFWRDADWIGCRDGRWRPVEPGTFPLAHGAPARMGRLRAYGNAINAEAAKAFIEAFLEGVA